MDKSTRRAQNVIEMSEYQPGPGFPAIAQVESYWEALRRGRLLPARADVDPRGIEQALEHAFVLERVAVGVGRIRVAGSHLGALMGMEVRGMPLTCLIAPADRPTVARALEETLQMPAVTTLDLEAPAGIGRGALVARMLLLPLTSDLGDVSRVLGCLVARGDIGAAPRRFEVTAVRTVPLAPQAAAEPAVRLPEAPGFAEPQRSFAEAGTTRRPPYLRLVKSDD